MQTATFYGLVVLLWLAAFSVDGEGQLFQTRRCGGHRSSGPSNDGAVPPLSYTIAVTELWSAAAARADALTELGQRAGAALQLQSLLGSLSLRAG
jgi:hypothetical protein